MITRFIKKIVDGHPFVPEDFDGIDVELFCQEIIDEGIASLFYPLLNNNNRNFPSRIIEITRKYYEISFLYKDYCIQKLRALQPSISKYGRIVLMQGFALLEDLYQEPFIRTMSDIDLYLPDGNMEHVRSELIKSGFSPYGTYRNVLNYKGLQIDLHSDLWGQDRVPMRRLFSPEKKTWFLPSNLIPGFYTIPLQHLLYHSVFHASKHSFNRKIWYVDLLLFQKRGLFSHLRNLDRFKLGTLVIDRFIADGYIDTNVNPIDTYRSWKNKIKKIVLNSPNKNNSGEILLALSLNSSGDSIRYLLSTIFLSRESLIDMYGCHLLIILYIKRICVIFKSFFKFIP